MDWQSGRQSQVEAETLFISFKNFGVSTMLGVSRFSRNAFKRLFTLQACNKAIQSNPGFLFNLYILWFIRSIKGFKTTYKSCCTYQVFVVSTWGKMHLDMSKNHWDLRGVKISENYLLRGIILLTKADNPHSTLLAGDHTPADNLFSSNYQWASCSTSSWAFCCWQTILWLVMETVLLLYGAFC